MPLMLWQERRAWATLRPQRCQFMRRGAGRVSIGGSAPLMVPNRTEEQMRRVVRELGFGKVEGRETGAPKRQITRLPGRMLEDTVMSSWVPAMRRRSAGRRSC